MANFFRLVDDRINGVPLHLNRSTIHLWANGEKQNGYPFRFGYLEANFIDKRSGCFEKNSTCVVYRLKQLLTSISVKMLGIYLHFGD